MQVNMGEPQISIVGAGIGGLTLALGLLQRGYNVHVFEQASELGEVGAGLSISPNAALGLEYLGMLDYMDAQSNIPLHQNTSHGLTNELLVSFDRTRARDEFGAAYYQIHRADFHSELVRRIEELNPDCVVLNYRLEALIQEENEISLRFENGECLTTNLVIAGDGVRSVIRDQVFGDCKPEFTGHMAWRGLIPAENLPDYFTEASSRVWLGEGRNCVTYPVRGKELVNFVALALADGWQDEGWSIRAEKGELAKTFQNFHELPRQAIAAIPEETIFRWGLFARKTVDSLVKGRVALLGDAAHPMLPYFGQGASSSIEDGVVLTRCFEESGDWQEAYQRYNNARLERVTALQRESNLGGERLHKLNPYDLRDKPVKNEDALGIFNYNPATVRI